MLSLNGFRLLTPLFLNFPLWGSLRNFGPCWARYNCSSGRWCWTVKVDITALFWTVFGFVGILRLLCDCLFWFHC